VDLDYGYGVWIWCVVCIDWDIDWCVNWDVDWDVDWCVDLVCRVGLLLWVVLVHSDFKQLSLHLPTPLGYGKGLVFHTLHVTAQPQGANNFFEEHSHLHYNDTD
jgi:hypothetical protein